MKTDAPTQLQPLVLADRWAVIIVRSNGELEALDQTYATEQEARDYALRACGWFQMVSVGVAPVTVHSERMAIVHDPSKPGVVSINVDGVVSSSRAQEA